MLSKNHNTASFQRNFTKTQTLGILRAEVNIGKDTAGASVAVKGVQGASAFPGSAKAEPLTAPRPPLPLPSLNLRTENPQYTKTKKT